MGALAQIAANPDSMIPTLGASGAIAGVMGAYVV
jgi:membrane associated rhomboid family serine protease